MGKVGKIKSTVDKDKLKKLVFIITRERQDT
jgi:hypothetical protein